MRKRKEEVESESEEVWVTSGVRIGGESAMPLPQSDFDGRPRWIGQKPDVGCFESVTPDGLLLIFK